MKRLAYLFLVAACGGAADVRPEADAAPGEGERLGVVRVVESAWGGHVSPEVRPRFPDREPVYHQRVATEGACELYAWDNPFCDPGCTDGFCVEGNRCEPWEYPPGSVGHISITGLAAAVELEPRDNGYAYPGDLPADLFADDAEIVLSATSPAFRVHGRGVPAIDIDGLDDEDQLTFPDGQDRVIRWTPSGVPRARVRLTMQSSNLGHGFPRDRIIRCEVDDAVGQVTVPWALLDGFGGLVGNAICVQMECGSAVLTRVREDSASVPGGHVSLEVVTERNFFGKYVAP